MKKILSVVTVLVLTVSLCVGVFADVYYSLDAVYINNKVYNTGEYQGTAGSVESSGLAFSGQLSITQGDKVYIMGWFASNESSVDKVVYRIDDETEYACSNNYRDRKEIASLSPDLIPWITEFEADDFTKSGFGSDRNMMELVGIGELPAGEYTLEIVGKFTNGDELVMKTCDLTVEAKAAQIRDFDPATDSVNFDCIFVNGSKRAEGAAQIAALQSGIDGSLELIDTIGLSGSYKYTKKSSYLQTAFDCFGYILDDNDPVFDESFRVTSDEYLATESLGTNYYVTVDVSGIKDAGSHVIRVCARLTNGETVVFNGDDSPAIITYKAPKAGTYISTDEPTYYIEAQDVYKGQTFDVYVSIFNNPGIISLRNSVKFDAYAFKIEKIENLGLLDGFTTPPSELSSPFTLRWANSLALANNDASGQIVKLTFSVYDDVISGEYEISIDPVESRNIDGTKIQFRGASVNVLVTSPLTGDADGDGTVTDWDGILFDRYLAAWPVTLHLNAMDVDKDGELSDWDAMLLGRYLAGWKIDELPDEPEVIPPQPAVVEFTVAKVFSKNMVVQRNEPLKIWGFAGEEAEGGIISAEFMGERAMTTVKDGEWMIAFDRSFSACADMGNDIKVFSKSMEVVLEDVLVGDVYMVIGQSNTAYDMNMHWASVDSNDIEKCGRNADYNSLPIRINYNTQNSPNTTVKRGGDEEAKDITRKNSWRIANRSNISSFSAIGYLFARNYCLLTDCEVPVGMIEIDGNGQPIVAFLCNEVAENNDIDRYDATQDCYMSKGSYSVTSRFLYNEFMAPFQRMPMAGILWYQGESDHPATEANRYPKLFTEYVEYMRGTHNIINRDFPVYFIEFPSMYTQPAGYTGTSWQYMDVGKIRGMMGNMVTMADDLFQVQSSDIWNNREHWNNLHPDCKYEQSLRAAKIACAYNGEGGITMDNASGPILESVTYSEDGLTAVLKYKNVGDGLKTIDGSDTVKGFNLVTRSNTVGNEVKGTIVSPDTVHVKLQTKFYGIAYNVKTGYYFGEDINLCNSAGIPAGAFMFKRQ